MRTNIIDSPSSPESSVPEIVLPKVGELEPIYRSAFENVPLPADFSYTEQFSESNVTCNVDDPTIVDVQNAFRAQATSKAVRDTWWVKASHSVRPSAVSPEQFDDLVLWAKHTLEVTTQGDKTDQYFEVYEVGTSGADDETRDSVFNTLKTIDQLSGGLSSADAARQSVVLSVGIPMKSNNGSDGEIYGAATDGLIYLNIDHIRRTALEAGVSYPELLSVVLIHEKLGHGLEYLTMGRSGKFLTDYFTYTQPNSRGALYDRIYGQVQPIDPEQSGSHPVREYGQVNPAEDLATSVDATYADAFAYTQTTDAVPKLRSEIDGYRRDLTLRFFQSAAAKAKMLYPDTPGFVGSEIGTDGKELRQLRLKTLYGQDAINDDIEKMVRSLTPEKLIVSAGDFV